MYRKSKNVSKFLNVFGIVLEIVVEIVLLPFHIIKAISNIVVEIRR